MRKARCAGSILFSSLAASCTARYSLDGPRAGSQEGHRCQRWGRPAAGLAAPCRRTPTHSIRVPDRHHDRGGLAVCSPVALPASRGSCRQRRSASRDNSTESFSETRPNSSEVPRCGQCSSKRPTAPLLSRNTTRSSPYNTQTPRQVLQFFRGNGLPAPQVLSAGRPWSNVG